MRILVTGANGLVGSRVCKQLAGKAEVHALGRGPRRVTGEFPYAPVDLGDEAALLAAVREIRPEVIVNSASMTEVDACEKDPRRAFVANGHAPANLALAANEVGAHLLHVSTDYVFDGAAGPYDEEALPNPRGVYAITKHIGEQAVRGLAKSWAIARTAVVYGWPAADRPNFGAWLLGALRSGQEVRMFEDQYVSPSFADNVAAMLVELAERRLPGIWHTAGADVVNRLEFGTALCEVFGFSKKLLVASKMADAKLASPRPARSGLKVDKALRELRAKPLGLRESLERFQQAFRSGETR